MATMASSKPSAAHRVFNIGELVELILIHVRSGTEYHRQQTIDNMKTILHGQQINSTCRAAVQNSPSIKRLLGILPQIDGEDWQFGIHPMFQASSPSYATLGDPWGWHFSYSTYNPFYGTGGALVMHADSVTLDFYARNPGSWRKLRWNLGGHEIEVCEVHFIVRGIAIEKIVVDIAGSRTAGELVDVVVKGVRQQYPHLR